MFEKIEVMEKLFKEPEGIIYNGGAIFYAITGYIVGFFGLFSVNIFINILSSTSKAPRTIWRKS